MIHGILNVYKEKGYTSHDVVAKLRGISRQRKIGHTGTLDPDAEGVLPVCFGHATKVCDILTDKTKTYEAVLLLGTVTDTQDAGGTVLQKSDTGKLSEDEVTEAVFHFMGSYQQIPPMYSALKVNGKKLYELAREGKVIERKARLVEIFQIRILNMALPRVTIEVTCSKGTYIRTLCHDIGERLKTGGCMESLLRTRVGDFALADSKTLAEIAEYKEKLSSLLIPVDHLFETYRRLVITESQERLLYNGNAWKPEENSMPDADGDFVRVYDRAGIFVAIYQYDGKENRYKAVKMFHT